MTSAADIHYIAYSDFWRMAPEKQIISLDLLRPKGRRGEAGRVAAATRKFDLSRPEGRLGSERPSRTASLICYWAFFKDFSIFVPLFLLLGAGFRLLGIAEWAFPGCFSNFVPFS